jgi:hypothetical protein
MGTHQEAGTIQETRWWTKELRMARKEFQRLSSKSFRKQMMPEHPGHEEYQKARNGYTQMIKDMKEEHWETWLEEMDEENLWKAHKLVVKPSSDGGRARIPVLREEGREGVQEMRNNEEKSQAFHEIFFPPPRRENRSYDDMHYPEPVCAFRNITDKQIARAIDKLWPYKGVMGDDIANVVLKQTKGIITPYLGAIYRATYNLKIYPKHWKIYDTCITRKPGKTDYMALKAYRPMCLLRTIVKPLSMATAKLLSYWIEKLSGDAQLTPLLDVHKHEAFVQCLYQI